MNVSDIVITQFFCHQGSKALRCTKYNAFLKTEYQKQGVNFLVVTFCRLPQWGISEHPPRRINQH
jgi:hypothetical protein